MARRLGCTFSAYSKWLRGERTPGGEWMLRILALCPDDETRAAFFLDIGDGSSKIRSTSQPEVPIKPKEAPQPTGAPAHAGIRSRYTKYKPRVR